MVARWVGGLALAVVVFAVPLESASANTLLLEEILTGGAPRGPGVERRARGGDADRGGRLGGCAPSAA